MDTFTDYGAVRSYLYSLKNRGAKYGIDRMRLLTEALGHPERRFPAIHIAGTNGKGSVAAMLESVYRKNNYNTGLYTSPHLVQQGERVQVDRIPLTRAEITDYTNRLRPVAEKLAGADSDDHPSFFEFMTAMAFLRFAEAKVDIGIVETGLGGRLDATNVLLPELSIITSVSLDHIEQLGDTLAKIAAEKAGIIKRDRPVLIGKLPAEAETVIREIAAERSSPVYSVRDRFPRPESLPQTNLEGSFQRWNAGVALYAAELLNGRFPVDAGTSPAALETVRWPGRWERVNLADRTLILDATHNPEGIAMLEENLDELIRKSGRKPVIVAGALGEHRARGLVPAVARHAAAIHFVEAKQTRATSTDRLLDYLPDDYNGAASRDTLERLFPAPGVCRAGEPGGTVVVTGSIYLIGEVMERLEGGSDPGDAMLQDTP